MSILVKDLPFLDFYSNKSKSTKKVQNVVFPNPVQFGVKNIATSSLQFNDSLFFKENGSDIYIMNSGSFEPGPGLSPTLDSSLSSWSNVYSASGTFSEQVNGKIKSYFPFQCVATTTSRFYIPWHGITDSTTITSADVGMTVVRPGRVLNVAVRSSLNVGSTVVSFHTNESATIIASDTSTLGSVGDRDVFDFGDDAEFVAGDILHVGVNPTSAGNTYWGMVEIEFDTLGSVGI